MTTGEFKKYLDQFLKENPKAMNLPVYYCVDDEGNGYDKVKFTPTVMNKENFVVTEVKNSENVKHFVCIN